MREFVRTWWIAALSIFGTTLAVTALVLAYPSFKRTAVYAKQGQIARERTIKVAPISCLNYRDQLNRGVISAEQFLYVTGKASGFPGVCPISPLPAKP